MKVFFLGVCLMGCFSLNATTHISEEEPSMIRYRCLLIDGCILRIKYKLMYEEINQESLLDILKEIEEIEKQIGTKH